MTSSENDLIAKRNNVILYVLNNASNKLPMKLSDFSFLGRPKDTQIYIAQAKKQLKKIYGIILEEVPEQKSGKKYICYCENSTMSIMELDEQQKRETTLLFIVLSYIFMSGGTVFEESLESFLGGLEIRYDCEHCYFGANVKKLITETFIKQLYLKRKKSGSEFDVEDKYIFQWDFRAEREFPKMKVLEMTAKLMGKSAHFFHTQYAAIEEEQNDVVEIP